jgi:hypothetical protein
VRSDVIGEVGIAEPRTRPDEPFTRKAGEALLDIGGILGTPLLAVIDDVQAAGDLLPHDLGHRRADSLGKGVPVVWVALIPEAQ